MKPFFFEKTGTGCPEGGRVDSLSSARASLPHGEHVAAASALLRSACPPFVSLHFKAHPPTAETREGTAAKVRDLDVGGFERSPNRRLREV